MIDPVHALAFSIHSTPGVYALLLGSGVSRASGIPTSWEVTLDLVRQLAALHGEDPDPAPEVWYHGKYGKDPDYSDILEELTKTPSERHHLLRSYWEPNGQEIEEGLKQPTVAHRAIAALAAQGFIRVILTTNFDHLLENALRDANIEPTVLSSPEQVEGALPLVHTQCCVIKLHGDYLDTRMRNTATELQSYSPQFDALLDRVLDEFGLIVCGWSADWDKALRDGVYRCQSRRFATYWSVLGNPSEEAQRLINHRRAEMVSIESADTFFHTLREHVQALEEFAKPHPLSVQAAVATMKRYMSEPRYRIQLSDLIDDAVKKVIESTSGQEYDLNSPQPSGEAFTSRVRGYEAACSTLLFMAPVAGFWAEPEHWGPWERAILRLTATENTRSYVAWSSLKQYPALLLLFALGIGALEAGRLHLLGRLFSQTIHTPTQGSVAACVALSMDCLAGEVVTLAKSLPESGNKHFPMSDWIYQGIRRCTVDLIPTEDNFALTFVKFEILLALGFVYHDSAGSFWAPQGIFVYRREDRNRVLTEIQESLDTLSDESPFVKCGIFGDTKDACNQAIIDLNGFIRRLGPWF